MRGFPHAREYFTAAARASRTTDHELWRRFAETTVNVTHGAIPAPRPSRARDASGTLAVLRITLRGRAHPAALGALTTVHWAWSGVAYHAVFFTRINPAAWFFAALFVGEALAFLWLGVLKRRLVFDVAWTPRHVLAAVFLLYSLVYPLLVWLSGHQFPSAPLFAVPCPTTLFTAGVLLSAAAPVPRWLFVVPIAWSVVGASAAVLLGMMPDLMLFVAGVCLAVYGMMPGLFRSGGLQVSDRGR